VWGLSKGGFLEREIACGGPPNYVVGKEMVSGAIWGRSGRLTVKEGGVAGLERLDLTMFSLRLFVDWDTAGSLLSRLY